MFNFIVFGPPGCGKGTQSKLIAEYFNFFHLSTGELFRKEINNCTPIGKIAKKFIDRGLLIPDTIVMRELYRFALAHKDAKGIVFDGFPRTIEQAKALDLVFNKKELQISLVIAISVSESELEKRIIERSKDSGRSDDTSEIIKKRIEVYNNQTKSVIEFYKQTGRLVEVDGNFPIKEVNKKINRIIELRIKKK